MDLEEAVRQVLLLAAEDGKAYTLKAAALVCAAALTYQPPKKEEPPTEVPKQETKMIN